MNARLSWLRSQAPRTLLAQLVIGISALVALASSPPPRWGATEEQQVQLVFAEPNERRVRFSIELAGPLYADLSGANVEISATADRTASDLELSVSPPEDSPEEADPAEPVAPDDADFRAGFEPDTDPLTSRPDVRNPNRAWLWSPLKCAEFDPAVPRAERCVEELEITVVRHSQRPLSVELAVRVQVDGSKATEPEGTFEIQLEEIDP